MTLRRFRAKLEYLKNQKEEKRRTAQILKNLEQETEFQKKYEHFFKAKRTITSRHPTMEEWRDKMGGLPTNNAELRLVIKFLEDLPALKLKDEVYKKLEEEFEKKQLRT